MVLALAGIAGEDGSCKTLSAELLGEHAIETVRQMENGEIAVWQRWLFREEHDYKAARKIIKGGVLCAPNPQNDISTSVGLDQLPNLRASARRSHDVSFLSGRRAGRPS
jgi:hypothetical protein